MRSFSKIIEQGTRTSYFSHLAELVPPPLWEAGSSLISVWVTSCSGCFSSPTLRPRSDLSPAFRPSPLGTSA